MACCNHKTINIINYFYTIWYIEKEINFMKISFYKMFWILHKKQLNTYALWRNKYHRGLLLKKIGKKLVVLIHFKLFDKISIKKLIFEIFLKKTMWILLFESKIMYKLLGEYIVYCAVAT